MLKPHLRIVSKNKPIIIISINEEYYLLWSLPGNPKLLFQYPEKGRTTGNLFYKTPGIIFRSNIQTIAYDNGYVLLLQDNGKFLILDSAYKRVGNLENNLAPILIPAFKFVEEIDGLHF